MERSEHVHPLLSPGAWLRLRLLGGCEIDSPEGRVHLETAKTQALLVYLSLTPRPVARQTLVGLLWSELPEVKARRNLRRALWNLRQQIAAPHLPPLLLGDRQQVHLNPRFPRWLDVQAFEAACTELKAGLSVVQSRRHLDALAQAVALYRGELLQGFSVEGAPAFESWLLGERERLRLMALEAIERLTAGYAARNEVDRAVEQARRLLQIEPWQESGYRRLMRLLARSGRRAAALAQYERCRRILAQELGVEPTAETVALAERIRAGTLGMPTPPLPAAATLFIGRERELGEVAALLARTDCRLLTVTGLGGVGKSRLALELAWRIAPRFADGVGYVALEALSSPEQLPGAIVRALDIRQAGMPAPLEALLAYLRNKRLLLLLDGFERLLPEVALLSRMLQAAPGLKLLVTSRERLNVRGEWLYPLEGLGCPPPDAPFRPTAYDAVRLFLRAAGRVRLDFRVEPETWPALIRLCRLLEGMPLAIEMAAAWVRFLSVEELASEVERGLDRLTLARREEPALRRSLRAVFERSWQRLSEEERRAFVRLSVFRGSFRRVEAQRVTGASLTTLAALVDKSLLYRLPSGRYRLHELVRRYAAGQLARDGEAEVVARERHCQTYAALVSAYRRERDAGRPMPILRLIGEEFDNIRAAWEWALERREEEALSAMLDGLADHFHLNSAFYEGERFFRRACAVLSEPGDRPPIGPLVLWRLRLNRAAFALYLGRLTAARPTLERALAIFAQEGAVDEVAHARFFLGEIARFGGDHEAAARLFAESLADYRRAGNRSAVGFCLNGLGVTALALGRLEEARAHLEESLRAFAAIGHEMGSAIAGINLAELLMRQGDFDAAEARLVESFTRCRRLGHRWGMAVSLMRRGDLAVQAGRGPRACEHYREALRLLLEIGRRRKAVACLIERGRLCAELGRDAEADADLRQAQELAVALEDGSLQAEAALARASLLAARGEAERALQLALLVVRAAPAPAVKAEAETLSEALSAELSEQARRRAERWAARHTLDGLSATERTG